MSGTVIANAPVGTPNTNPKSIDIAIIDTVRNVDGKSVNNDVNNSGNPLIINTSRIDNAA
jgi:hypothetical protein